MKLYFSGRDYIHKVLVVAAEAGVLDQLEFETENPIDRDAPIWKVNPLGRHPVLVLDDGLVLNANFAPLNVCHLRRALGLVLEGRAELVATVAAM